MELTAGQKDEGGALKGEVSKDSKVLKGRTGWIKEKEGADVWEGRDLRGASFRKSQVSQRGRLYSASS